MREIGTLRALSSIVVLSLVGACHRPAPEPAGARIDPGGHDAASAPAAVPSRPDETRAAAATSGPNAWEAFLWVVETINSGGKVTSAEIERRFDASFLESVPVAQVEAVFSQLGASLPPVRVRKAEKPDSQHLEATVETAQGPRKVLLQMTQSEPRKIAGLLVRPVSAEPLAKTYDEVAAQLKEQGTAHQMLIAEIDARGRCRPVRREGKKAPLAIGSAFKLWVLLALEHKIERDDMLSWATELAIDDTLKSLPSGVMQNLPAGSRHTLREFATQMISISDNTATDHLIAFVGRPAVEAALRAAKHSKPAANVPFLMTRELFALKLLAGAEEVAAYKKAGPSKKRQLLDGLRARELAIENASAWDAPRHLDVEWFADAEDMCRVMAALARAAKFDPGSEILQVLGKNPGVELDGSKWRYVGYKGGSEPGVVNLTWLLQRHDHKWFAVVVTVNHRERALAESEIFHAAESLLKILGEEH